MIAHLSFPGAAQRPVHTLLHPSLLHSLHKSPMCLVSAESNAWTVGQLGFAGASTAAAAHAEIPVPLLKSTPALQDKLASACVVTIAATLAGIPGVPHSATNAL